MQSLFLSSFEKAFDIGLCLGLSQANVIPCIKTISGFCFSGHQIRKSSFSNVGCKKLNKHHKRFFAENWIRIMTRQLKAGKVGLVVNSVLHGIQNLNSANSFASAIGLTLVLITSLCYETGKDALLK